MSMGRRIVADRITGKGADLTRKGDPEISDDAYDVLAMLGDAMTKAQRALEKALDAEMGDIDAEASALKDSIESLDSMEQSGVIPKRKDVEEFLSALSDLLSQASAIPAQAGMDLDHAHSIAEGVLAEWDTVEAEMKSGARLMRKASRKGGSPFTRQERSESGITESLDHVTQCADAASHFWTAGDAEEAMSALDDLIAEAKAAKQRIANHGEQYPPEPEEVVEEASARKARIEERSAHVVTKSEPGTPGFNKEIAYSLGQISERLEGVDSEGQQLVDDARNYFDDLADEMAG